MADRPRQGGGTQPTTLRDLMHTGVIIATPDTLVADAAAAMVKARVGSTIVMQASFLAGILTERDVLRAAASGENLSGSVVAAWMTPDPQSVTPDTPIEDAAQIMLLHGFRHLPVVEGKEVRGVVSLRDLFAARIRRRPTAGTAMSAGGAD
ncbi:MAG TPA: CBS domain-containing protein [Streptosporangiaceae bacterium]|nr:CBS domain-containing protein [Streptosporangiaceae bacterium]